MRWAVPVSVVLVNMVWILLFFTTDDFSETVWRRRAEEEELIGEFCLQLPHVNVSLNQSSSPITSEENKTLKAQTSKPEAETPITECSAENVITTTPLTTGSANGQENCCFTFYPRRLSKDKIVSYSMTDERCPKIGVILLTQKSKKVCADPNLSWVQGIMRHVDQKSF